MTKTTEKKDHLNTLRPYFDLRVALTIELGRASMRVQDVLELRPDSVVRLTRSTGEGVDIRADDLPLMRGEIVVIEDKAAVRVSELLSDQR